MNKKFCKLKILFVITLYLPICTHFGCSKRNDKFTENTKTNVLLISIDTLRPDHLRIYGYNRSTTPYIESLASEGTVFENVFVPLPATSASHASLFTSLHPLKHKIFSNGMKLEPKIETIAEVFQKNNYHTMGVVSVGHIGKEFGYDKGFDKFSDKWDSKKDGNTESSRSAKSSNISAEEFLEDYQENHSDKPFFMFLHYFDAHAPYDEHPSISFKEELDNKIASKLNKNLMEMVNNYDKEIKYVDENIENIVEKIKKISPKNNLIIAITSDHGEQFGEHNYFGGHADIYKETVRVPLIFWGKNISKQRLTQNVSSMNTPVTLLNLTGLKFSNGVDGMDSFNKTEKESEFLIIGYPGYALSAAIIQNSKWYYENMDFNFKYMYFPDSNKIGAGFKSIDRLKSELDENIYAIEYNTDKGIFSPAFVSVFVEMNNNSCEAKLRIGLEQGNPYFPYGQFHNFKSHTQIDYPVRPFDVTTLKISPKECIKKVSYKTTRYSKYVQSLSSKTKKLETEIFRRLLSDRKNNSSDELYEVETDQDMIINLIEKQDQKKDISQMRKQLVNKYIIDNMNGIIKITPGVEPDSKTVKALKSLGYLQ